MIQLSIRPHHALQLLRGLYRYQTDKELEMEYESSIRRLFNSIGPVPFYGTENWAVQLIPADPLNFSLTRLSSLTS